MPLSFSPNVKVKRETRSSIRIFRFGIPCPMRGSANSLSQREASRWEGTEKRTKSKNCGADSGAVPVLLFVFSPYLLSVINTAGHPETTAGTKQIKIMKNVFIAFALASCSMMAQAQAVQEQQDSHKWKVEAETGVSLSVLDIDVSGLPNTEYKVRPGFTFGVAAEYNVVDNLAVGLGVRFVQRNYLYQNLGGDAWNTRYTNNFISVPLTVGYYFIHNPYKEKGLWLKPQVGVYYEYFTSMHTKGTYIMDIMEGYEGDGVYLDYETTYDFGANENHLRRSLFGGEVGIQAGYSFGRIDAFASYRYQYGFSHIYQEKSLTSKTARRNSSVITVGASYKF